MDSREKWRIVNPEGIHRVIVTKELPGDKWLHILTEAGCRVEICAKEKILEVPEIIGAMGKHLPRGHRPAHGRLGRKIILRPEKCRGDGPTATMPWDTIMWT